MNPIIEAILVEWGQQQASPVGEVAVPCVLGHVDEAAPGVGGHRCLSLVEQHVVQTQLSEAVGQSLAEIDAQGWKGRELTAVAEVRYVAQVMLPLVEQYRRLGCSRNTYRARLNRLHADLLEVLPGAAMMAALEAKGVEAAKVRTKWLAEVRKAARRAEPAIALAQQRARLQREAARAIKKAADRERAA